jgi:hypothetical protein
MACGQLPRLLNLTLPSFHFSNFHRNASTLVKWRNLEKARPLLEESRSMHRRIQSTKEICMQPIRAVLPILADASFGIGGMTLTPVQAADV